MPRMHCNPFFSPFPESMASANGLEDDLTFGIGQLTRDKIFIDLTIDRMVMLARGKVLLVMIFVQQSLQTRLPWFAGPKDDLGCFHGEQFLQVGHRFTDDSCKVTCLCQAPDTLICTPLCQVERVRCSPNMYRLTTMQRVPNSRCSCPKTVCVDPAVTSR
ncbi:uncharacterized protein LOC116616118 isoform X2 [Nematostella vectensis]|uniref:uncharacterized protein LOC116616118 isoform X2 n=1 Tax=Nematostella vectensis TaxID=45351 RepID=UPI00138FAF12|nr:uncharacterized protein LOC116616118 isoform X2 [Nematostella vectensis]